MNVQNTELQPYTYKTDFPRERKVQTEIHELENSELMPRARREASFENKQALTNSVARENNVCTCKLQFVTCKLQFMICKVNEKIPSKDRP